MWSDRGWSHTEFSVTLGMPFLFFYLPFNYLTGVEILYLLAKFKSGAIKAEAFLHN